MVVADIFYYRPVTRDICARRKKPSAILALKIFSPRAFTKSYIPPQPLFHRHARTHPNQYHQHLNNRNAYLQERPRNSSSLKHSISPMLMRRFSARATRRRAMPLELASPSRRMATRSSLQAQSLWYVSQQLLLKDAPLIEPSQCQNCRKEIVNTNKKQLEVHAETHSAEWTKEKCWPNDFPAGGAA
jgi:hypothetical protein